MAPTPRHRLDLELRAEGMRARRSSAVVTGGRLPEMLVIGTPRGGTTSLATHLAAHPQVYVAPEKEVHFFDDHYERGLDWYRSRFAGAAAGQLCCDATPTYLANRAALERMAQSLQRPRLIVVLRDPIDRAYSAYWYLKVFIPETFEVAVEQELAGSGPGNRWGLLNAGFYARHLHRVHEFFGEDRLHVVLFDDLRADPGGVMRRVYRFAGVDEDVEAPHLEAARNVAARFRSERLVRAMLRLHLYERLPALATRVDRINRAPLEYPPLDPALRRRLVDVYSDDRMELEKMVGRDLVTWAR